MAMYIDIVTMYDMNVIIDVTPGLLAVFSFLTLTSMPTQLYKILIMVAK